MPRASDCWYRASIPPRASSQLIVQESARETPVAIDRAPREFEHLRDLLQRKAREVVQFDHARSALVGAFELLQRGLESECLLRALNGDHRIGACERHALPVAAGFQTQPIARAIAQQVAHGARCVREKLCRM